jgi:DNA-binding MarR family transcriptional regulator
MRRLWRAVPHGPDMSSVLVVEACAREQGPVSVGDVAPFADVEHSTASRLVERAVQSGYVERTAGGRRAALHLTTTGRALRERAAEFRTTWLTEVLDDWTTTDVATLAHLLGRFATRITDRGTPRALVPPSEDRV